MKKGVKPIIIACVFVALFLIGIVSCLTDDSHGDGKSTCKNCGKKEVYAMGFCKSCYRSFYDYTWGDAFTFDENL